MDTVELVNLKLPLKSHLHSEQRGARQERFEVVFSVLFCLLFCVFYIAGQRNLFPWAILVLDLFCLALGKPSTPILFSAFMVGNEAVSVLILLSWLLAARDVNLALLGNRRFGKGALALVFLIVAISFGQSWRAGTIANTILSCVYLALVGLVAYACRQSVSYERLLNSTQCFIVAEFFASLVICARVGFEPGDSHFGTLGNAHFFGIACALFLLLTLYAAFKRRDLSSKMAVLYIAMLLFMMWEADAKAAIGAGFIAGAIFLIFWKIHGGYGTIAVYLWAMVAFFLIGSILLEMLPVRLLLTNENFPMHAFFSDYVYDGGIQNKFDYFTGTTDQMLSDGHIIYGYGLGTYGSRFANMLGYTYTYRDPGAINELAEMFFSSRMIPEYAQFASLYNQSMHDVIQWYSAVMTYPFASFVAMIGETGLIGVAVIGIVLRRAKLAPMAQVCVAFFVGICLTDMYFDHIEILGLAIMMCAGFNQISRPGLLSQKFEAGEKRAMRKV